MQVLGLHIVAFDVPFPADYGGVIDIFNKIKSLHAKGVKIHLHAFAYGRPQAPELLDYCEKVHYYPRSDWRSVFAVRPYIVASRDNWQLLQNLMCNSWPILFEGLHTCFFLNHKRLAKRKKLVRLHNIEHEYYAQLALSETSLFKKVFYKSEAIKLKWFEAIVVHAQYLVPISNNDLQYFKNQYPTSSVHLIDPWVNGTDVNIASGKGQYLLYHGNLSVQENNMAALFLVKEVFSKIDFPFVIAGKNPSDALKVAVANFSNGKIVENPEEAHMQQLIADAHVHLLYTSQNTGIKLKLFNSLYHGRFCIANEVMLSGMEIPPGVQVANTAEQIIKTVLELLPIEFEEQLISDRIKYFSRSFNNIANTEKLLPLLAN